MRLGCVLWLSVLVSDVSSAVSPPPSSKIIGGEFVEHQSDFAFMVSVRVNRRHICGGSIVDYRHVLTAAHCCFDAANKPYPPQIMSIAAGSLNIGRSNNNSVVKGVLAIIPHKKYDWERITNDVAVIKILGQFELWNRNISAISLSNFIRSGSWCTICGWGITRFNTSQVSYRLRYVDVPVVSQSTCEFYYPGRITNKMICAGGNGSDSCQGDSGGPLICGGVLAGIVSWGSDCGVYPGVYTAVAPYKSWIRKYIDNSSSSWITPSERQACLVILQVLFAYYIV
ncbi:trypsin alpha-3-like [Zophobas morio]|uniref:trypsin alpha-3-like n=1 Tax=Zophobas morio TaxID=2755281 RepID=UPI0030829652